MDVEISELITKAKTESVRITVEIIPDENGRVAQRLEIEPWKPFQPYCPFHNCFIREEEKNEHQISKATDRKGPDEGARN